MKTISCFALFVVALFVLTYYGCDVKNKDAEQNKDVAKKYCGSCHLFPEASLLNKSAWLSAVLPPMGKQLGILYSNGQAYLDLHYSVDSNNNYVVTKTGVSIEDWNKIVAYYQAEAPDSLPLQNRKPVTDFTKQFTTHELALAPAGYCATCYVGIDPGNHWLYAANAFDSSFSIYNEHLDKLASANIHGALVDINFQSSLSAAGIRNGIFTNIGIMNPNDKKAGTADSFNITSDGKFSVTKRILDSMPRPVQTTRADFNNDGLQDYLVCGFGNNSGALYIEYNRGNGKFERRDIRSLPGAIKAYIVDFNKDGLPDILALMTQAQEGIFLFTNKGNGNFDTKEILRFSPIYGSSYFELDDFNHDGYPDILYTCGDNADYTPQYLKAFHGVYIYSNDGNNNFKQKYFYPIHGCFKAIARDFDKDGDPDIATISFFPDSKNQPTEGFIYLENKGNLQFQAGSIKEFAQGKWLTMDAGDINGDGYDDIVIGSLVPPVRSLVNKEQQQKTKKSALLLLMNNGKTK
ncbi:MAG: repeat-containing protein [Chitinophagaceae bacterium]|nr:repeat-containing protein [Chitinophagaceae bacterium]